MNKSFVLIDNDPLIRKAWEFQAEKSDIKVNTFSSVENFLSHAKNFHLETFIYVDSELDDGVMGEVEAKKISELGFKEIRLATGRDTSELELPSYILEVCSKRPPF